MARHHERGACVSAKSVVSAVPTRTWHVDRGDGRQVIAVLAPNYGLERVSYMIPSARHRYVKLPRIPLQRFERKGTFLDQSPLIVGPKVDLVHTFNQLPVNRAFAVSVEMELPRFLANPPAWQIRMGMERLRSDRCRGIWPLSEAARAYLLRRFERLGYGELGAKMEVFRGAVPPLPTGIARTGYAKAGPVKLLFVGGDGLRKGLLPTLEAAQRLRDAGVEVELTVVGSPTSTVYIVPGVTFPVEPVAALLGQPWVTRHATLPNAEVRRLMTSHDILVFPTMDESLGWVVAEAALSGMPSIATNIFALPELVLDGESGWTIAVPLNEDLRWAHIGTADRDAWDSVQAHIRDSMIDIVAAAAADRHLIERFGVRARDHIHALYDIGIAGEHLDRLYGAAIQP